MSGRACTICENGAKLQLAAELIAVGVSDQIIADQLKVGRMSVARHRVNHGIKPLQDQLAIAGKGAEEKRERKQLAAAAASDTPSPAEVAEALLGLKAQVAKLRRIEERLERMAALAEAGESPAGVAQLAAQQLRSVEVGSKLAGVGGYAPGKSAGDGAPVQTFTININLPGGTETIATTLAGTASHAELLTDD
jgi:hypothetical protein